MRTRPKAATGTLPFQLPRQRCLAGTTDIDQDRVLRRSDSCLAFVCLTFASAAVPEASLIVYGFCWLSAAALYTSATSPQTPHLVSSYRPSIRRRTSQNIETSIRRMSPREELLVLRAKIRCASPAAQVRPTRERFTRPWQKAKGKSGAQL